MYRYLLLLTVITDAAAQLASCFFPNGTALPLSRGYQPCISTQNVVSMCCVLNITALEANGGGYNNFDTCLTNGLCQTPNDVNGGYSRGFCTDKTWKSPNCLNACTNSSNGGTSTDQISMTQCPDGSWCCGLENSTCCGNSFGFPLSATIAPYITGISLTGNSTSTAASTPAATSSPTSISSPNIGKSGSENHVLIGFVAALGVIAIIATLIGLFLWRSRRVSRRGIVELSDTTLNRSTIQMKANSFMPVRPANPKLQYEAPATVPVEIEGDCFRN